MTDNDTKTQNQEIMDIEEQKQTESVYRKMPELIEAGFATWLQDQYGPGVVYMLDDYLDIMEKKFGK